MCEVTSAPHGFQRVSVNFLRISELSIIYSMSRLTVYERQKSGLTPDSGNPTQFKYKHEGKRRIKYPCNQCDSVFTQQGSFHQHIRSKHEGIKYPCNQCDFQATKKSNLQKHIKYKHEGKRRPEV